MRSYVMFLTHILDNCRKLAIVRYVDVIIDVLIVVVNISDVNLKKFRC